MLGIVEEIEVWNYVMFNVFVFLCVFFTEIRNLMNVFLFVISRHLLFQRLWNSDFTAKRKVKKKRKKLTPPSRVL